MTPIPIEGPAVEPVTVSEMRGFLRLDDGAEDALVADLIRAARLQVEAFAGRVLLSSRWRLLLDRWPLGGIVTLSIGPVLAVEAVRVTGASGAAALVAPTLYDLAPGDPARLVVEAGRPEPFPLLAGIAIDLRAGYGESPADVPAPLVQAVRLLVARSFEHRGDGEEPPPPPELHALLAPFRRARL
jgi:uncharacterized phiE125 gp8 family phage protein